MKCLLLSKINETSTANSTKQLLHTLRMKVHTHNHNVFGSSDCTYVYCILITQTVNHNDDFSIKLVTKEN